MTRVTGPRIALEKREEYPGKERIALEKREEYPGKERIALEKRGSFALIVKRDITGK